MTADHYVLPAQAVQDVEMWVDGCLDRSAKYDNAELLDENDVFTLHRLAAALYARGWQDGAMAERERNNGTRRRARSAS